MTESHIKIVTIRIPDYLYEFYQKVGMQVGLTPERVMGEALFSLAGGLSADLLEGKIEKPQDSA